VRSQWAAAHQTLLVHCGRLSVEKHAHRSVETVASLRDSGIDARLVVVGEGPMRSRLERQATGLPVTFTGYVGCRSTVASILASADVALAPGPHETFGLAALEALASGTPAVVSKSSALAELLTSDSGAAADDDPAAIAAAVGGIISTPETVRRTGARRRAEQFSWPTSAAGMLEVLTARAG
jgi:alpha-1,6-mannosyltransferase